MANMAKFKSTWLESRMLTDHSAPLLSEELYKIWNNPNATNTVELITPVHIGTILSNGQIEQKSFFYDLNAAFEAGLVNTEIEGLRSMLTDYTDTITARIIFAVVGSKFLAPAVLDVLGFALHVDASLFLEKVKAFGSDIPARPSLIFGISGRADRWSCYRSMFCVTKFRIPLLAGIPVTLILCSTPMFFGGGKDRSHLLHSLEDLWATTKISDKFLAPSYLDERFSFHRGVDATVVDLFKILIDRLDPSFVVSCVKHEHFFLLPVLPLEYIQIRFVFELMASPSKLDDRSLEDMRYRWFYVRDCIDVVRASMAKINCSIRQSRSSGSELELALDRIIEIIHELLVDGDRLESAIRDESQILAGQFSIDEAKRSIKQSELAITDAKRVRNITVLAFVFIPLSLATSVFGMNIQELNASGQDIWVFITTALAIYIVTFLLWQSGISFLDWRNRNWKTPAIWESRPLGERLYAILWLIRHKYAWKRDFEFRRITLGLLTDGRIGRMPGDWDFYNWNLYSLSKFIQDSENLYFYHPYTIYLKLVEQRNAFSATDDNS